jgi:putative acetyltransferase
MELCDQAYSEILTCYLYLLPPPYSEAQVRAWATFANDAERFRHRLTEGCTLVAELDESVVAFGQLHPQNHIEMLYCRSAYGGRGIGTALLQELEQVARLGGAKSLSTDASIVAEAFFLKRGYHTSKMERVPCFELSWGATACKSSSRLS